MVVMMDDQLTTVIIAELLAQITPPAVVAATQRDTVNHYKLALPDGLASLYIPTLSRVPADGRLDEPAAEFCIMEIGVEDLLRVIHTQHYRVSVRTVNVDGGGIFAGNGFSADFSAGKLRVILAVVQTALKDVGVIIIHEMIGNQVVV